MAAVCAAQSIGVSEYRRSIRAAHTAQLEAIRGKYQPSVLVGLELHPLAGGVRVHHDVHHVVCLPGGTIGRSIVAGRVIDLSVCVELVYYYSELRFFDYLCLFATRGRRLL